MINYSAERNLQIWDKGNSTNSLCSYHSVETTKTRNQSKRFANYISMNSKKWFANQTNDFFYFNIIFYISNIKDFKLKWKETKYSGKKNLSQCWRQRRRIYGKFICKIEFFYSNCLFFRHTDTHKQILGRKEVQIRVHKVNNAFVVSSQLWLWYSIWTSSKVFCECQT